MQESSESLSVVFMGHTQSGKSLLAAQLGLRCKAFSGREVKKYDKDGKVAWLVDRSEQERADGVSRGLGRFAFQTETRRTSVFVAPGTARSLHVACRGISSADLGVLVVDASPAEFDQGLSKHTGMSLEHVLLAYALGVPHLVIVVNKMDSTMVNYSQARFEEAKTDIVAAVKKLGYPPDSLTVIPTSGLVGENIVELPSSTMSWYKGPTLKQLIDETPVPTREPTKPLRLVVRDVFRGGVSAGKVEQGTISVGQVVTMAPRMITTVVQSIERLGESVQEASAGDVVGVVLKDVDMAELDRAAVIGDAKNPPRLCAQFVARIQPIHLPHKIKLGYSPVIICHMGAVPCAFAKLLNKTDKKDKKKILANPEFIAKGESGLVLLVPLRPLVLDAFDNVPSLGRFAIRDNGETRALGKIQISTPEESKKLLIIREHTSKFDH